MVGIVIKFPDLNKKPRYFVSFQQKKFCELISQCHDGWGDGETSFICRFGYFMHLPAKYHFSESTPPSDEGVGKNESSVQIWIFHTISSKNIWWIYPHPLGQCRFTKWVLCISRHFTQFPTEIIFSKLSPTSGSGDLQKSVLFSDVDSSCNFQ